MLRSFILGSKKNKNLQPYKMNNKLSEIRISWAGKIKQIQSFHRNTILYTEKKGGNIRYIS